MKLIKFNKLYVPFCWLSCAVMHVKSDMCSTCYSFFGHVFVSLVDFCHPSVVRMHACERPRYKTIFILIELLQVALSAATLIKIASGIVQIFKHNIMTVWIRPLMWSSCIMELYELPESDDTWSKWIWVHVISCVCVYEFIKFI